MGCEKYLEWMSAALDGELTAGERRELEAHLAGCPECAGLFDRLSRQSSALRGLDCEPPAGLRERILANLPAQDRPAKKTPRWGRWASLAACLVVIAGACLTVPRLFSANDGSGAPAEMNNGQAPEDGLGVGRLDSSGGYSLENGKIEPDFYSFEDEQCIRVTWGFTPAAPSARILGGTEELTEFLAQFPLDDLSAVADAYGEDFFATGRLLAVVLEANSGSIRYEIAAQGLTRDQVTIVSRVPEVGTDDMAAWLILAEVDGMFEGGETLDVVFSK